MADPLEKDSFRVLVVDDDREQRMMLEDSLTFYGPRHFSAKFEVMTLNSDKALEAFTDDGVGKFAPDLVIVDQNFTEVGGRRDDGIEKIVPRLRAMKGMTDEYPEFSEIKIVLYSANIGDHEVDDLRRKAMLAGADDFWFKDQVLDPKSLIENCLHVLGVRRPRK